MRSVFLAVAVNLALAVNSLPAAALKTRTETFDVDPGWTTVGSGMNGNDFGYQTTANAGGSPGEAGGRFTRSDFVRYYGDINLGGTLNLEVPISASGRFDHTSRSHPDFGNGVLVGHFDRTINPGAWIGVFFTDNGTSDLWWGPELEFNNNHDLGNFNLPRTLIRMSPNQDHAWSYSWDPNSSEFTITLDDFTQVMEIPSDIRLIGADVDAFGLAGESASNPTSSYFADMFIDDVTYSIAEPIGANRLVPRSYAMPNGESGDFKYWDQSYSGAGNTTQNLAPLTGGLGDLTDGIIASGNWFQVENIAGTGPYVGWVSVDPTLTFSFPSVSAFTKVRVHIDDSNNQGGVNPPDTIDITDGVTNLSFPVADPEDGSPFWLEFDVTRLEGSSLELMAIRRPATPGPENPALDSWIMLSEVEFFGGPPLLGDMDRDNDVDFDDISPFVLALNNETAYEMMFGVPPEFHGDIDGSGNHDFDDIPGFVELIVGNNATGRLQAVPEPSAILLAATGIVGVLCSALRRKWRATVFGRTIEITNGPF